MRIFKPKEKDISTHKPHCAAECETTKIEAMTIRGVHDRAILFLDAQMQMRGLKSRDALEIGAGQGAFSVQMQKRGWNVKACDIYPEKFKAHGIECRAADITRELPYSDSAFDLVVAVEVVEHFVNHETVFSEVYRVLRSGGLFFITTPNILSLKSRLQYLLSGYFYTFKPVDFSPDAAGLCHVASLTLNSYVYLLEKHGFGIASVGVDKFQRSSLGWLTLLYPAITLGNFLLWKNHPAASLQNSLRILLGRILFILASKEK